MGYEGSLFYVLFYSESCVFCLRMGGGFGIAILEVFLLILKIEVFLVITLGLDLLIWCKWLQAVGSK